jgi:hypothetical protein
MTPFDNYIRKNPPQHTGLRDICSKMLVSLSLALAVVFIVLLDVLLRFCCAVLGDIASRVLHRDR